jgi:inorganic pyrophosphatase
MLRSSESYSTTKIGQEYTLDYKLYFKNEKMEIISPWNDIPFKTGTDNTKNEFRCVVEIPKDSMHKLEMSKHIKNNPITHDTNKDNSIRTFPFPIKWNYGFIPQTWEDPNIKIKSLNDLSGDNDPVDVVILGNEVYSVGTVLDVKVIGAYAMIDNNEVDYKVIAIDSKQTNAFKINTDTDVRKYLDMNEIHEIKEWFRAYKPNSNPPTYFGYDESLLSINDTIKILDDTHDHWMKLPKNLPCSNI